jgi:hypothetical protein
LGRAYSPEKPIGATNSNRIFLFENPRTFTGVWTNYSVSTSPYAIIGPRPNARVADLRTGNLNFPLSASSFAGSGSGLTLTNAAGAKFRLLGNDGTNGFIFVPQ